ncbi:MAG TPA: endonuclease/exonuclease/phosphatase family protein [Gammaproteobacteria bacterium]|nr:endonuclease/exonuclease/phosphatase family protein [Gammaproteobacteria bacterium]
MARFSLLTFNVLGVPKQMPETQYHKRISHIFNEVVRLHPTIVAFQEVPVSDLDRVVGLAHELSYQVSITDKKEIVHDGKVPEICCVTLSRIKCNFQTYYLPFSLNNLDYHAVLMSALGIQVLNVHLQHGANNQDIRTRQLSYLKESILKPGQEVILCGDFNIDFSRLTLPASFTGCFESTYDVVNELGGGLLTQDIMNPLYARLKPSGICKQPDNIFLLNKDNLEVKSCSLQMVEIPGVHEVLNYSDHYGLLCDFQKSD